MVKALQPLQKNEKYFIWRWFIIHKHSVKGNNDYVILKIYNEKLLKPIYKNFFSKLYKWATDCKIQCNQSYYKKIDSCTMGGPLSVILANIHMIRNENELVTPMNPPFYKQFVENIYSKRNKSQQDDLLEALNNFLPNIKLTIEVNPEKLLDTIIILNSEGVVSTQVYQKENK